MVPEHIVPYDGNLPLLQSDVFSETENVVKKYGLAVMIPEGTIEIERD